MFGQVPVSKIVCKNGNQARVVCTNPNCMNSAFLCMKHQCQYCQSNHQQCRSHFLKYLCDLLNIKKLPLTDNIRLGMQKMIEVYEDAKKLIDQKILQLKLQLKWYGFSLLERKIFNKILKEKTQDIYGKDLYIILRQAHKRARFNCQPNKVQSYWKAKKNELDKYWVNFYKYCQNSSQNIDSKIIKQQDVKFLQLRFEGKVIGKLQLMYRASEHNFDTDSFHKLCDNLGNILIVAKTQEGKIVGGFNKHKFLTHPKYIKDPKRKCFLFSLTDQMVYWINSNYKQYAIYNDPKQGPGFGAGPDFQISKFCNMNKKSIFKVGVSYEANNNTGILGNINIVEWEAFKIEFQKNKQ